MIFDLILVVGLFASAAGVAILYAVIAPWHTSTVGRALMGLLVCIAILTGLSLAGGLFGEFPYFRAAARTAYVLIITALLSLGVVMLYEQRNGGDSQR